MMKVTIKEGEGKKWCLQIKSRHIREECAVVSDGRTVVFHPFCGCGEVFSRFLQIYFLLTGYFFSIFTYTSYTIYRNSQCTLGISGCRMACEMLLKV